MLEVRSGFELEDHLPEAVAFAAFDDFHGFEAGKRGVGAIEPFAKGFIADQCG